MGGLPDVPVYVDNQLIARTDANGRVLIHVAPPEGARRRLKITWRVKVISPTVTVEARRVEGGVAQAVAESLASEVPVAIQFNGRAHAR